MAHKSQYLLPNLLQKKFANSPRSRTHIQNQTTLLLTVHAKQVGKKKNSEAVSFKENLVNRTNFNVLITWKTFIPLMTQKFAQTPLLQASQS